MDSESLLPRKKLLSAIPTQFERCQLSHLFTATKHPLKDL